MEFMRVVLLDKRQRLKLDAMAAVSSLFFPNGGAGEAEGDAGIRTLLTAVAKGVLREHADEGHECCAEEDEYDPDYCPNDEPDEVEEPEDIPSVMVFFSALINERPVALEMLASDLYDRYKRFCEARHECCDGEDTLAQAQNSFGARVRTINGVHKRTTPEGTRYTLDPAAILEHLRGKGLYCEAARLY